MLTQVVALHTTLHNAYYRTRLVCEARTLSWRDGYARPGHRPPAIPPTPHFARPSANPTTLPTDGALAQGNLDMWQERDCLGEP